MYVVFTNFSNVCVMLFVLFRKLGSSSDYNVVFTNLSIECVILLERVPQTKVVFTNL